MRSPSSGLDLLADDQGQAVGAAVARVERDVDPVVVGDRQVGQAARDRGLHHRCRIGQRIEAPARMTVQIDECARRPISGPSIRVELDQTSLWTSDFLKKSKCSRARPVPSATQFSGFSATWHGTPVTWVRSLSMLRSIAPPPDMTMPLSMMSERQLGRRLLEDGADRGDELLERRFDGLHHLASS